ncbi:MAG: aminopeptidase P family protein [Chitinophagaceae bacterium]|nr:aminopeptidase P family protein [Chitinophagaceae bacterium]
MKRRRFITGISVIAGSRAFAGFSSFSNKQKNNMGNIKLPGIQLITVEERMQRIEKAQRLMAVQKIGALILDAGTSMEYFSGMRWGQSERPMVVIIPVKGELVYVCPAFEEDRLRENITVGNKVYIWEEDENPYKKMTEALTDAGIRSGDIAIEERVRFFIVDGIKKASGKFNFKSGDPVSAACRLIKSPAEIALMQAANDATALAITEAIKGMQEGMFTADVGAIIAKQHRALGAMHDFALVLFGTSSALPHGSSKPQVLKKGDIVLMDCGCRVGGYSADITRTIVFGAEPTKRQLEIWNLEQQSQAAGFVAAKNGATCESVDAAARKVIVDAGFGPGYKLPGLPHRTGHGIGMDGHEWGNMVKGNKQILQPGMCFSIEPTIAIPGEFGVRLEDCVYMTDSGPKWFSKTAKSMQLPFG